MREDTENIEEIELIKHKELDKVKESVRIDQVE